MSDGFDDEVRTHLQFLAERYVRQGMSPDEAAAAARRQFGNLTLLEENRREMRTFSVLENLWRDLRYALRQLRRNPLFTTIAVLSLALGIGANTAVFTLLDQLMLRLLPVQKPERLVMIWSTGPHLGSNQNERTASYPMYQDFQRKAEAFESVFCRYFTPLALNFDGATERVTAELVSGNYFQALGVGPAVGRVFSPEADDRVYKGHPVAVLSYPYWVSRFGADPKVVGKKILVNNYPMEIVGVSAAGFTGLDPTSSPSIRIPIQMKPLMTPGSDNLGNRRSQWVQIFARMKPGYTVESARASLQPLFHQILQQELQEPELRGVSAYNRARFNQREALVETAATGYSGMRQESSTALLVLMAMAGLILLISCSNVASLLIARAVARQKEMAVRLAIGAARTTLIGHLLVESVLLSLAGAALGLLLSGAAIKALLSLVPTGSTPLLLRAEPDLRILLFSMAVALATGLLFGLAPALQATRLDLWSSLKDVVGAVAGDNGSARLRKALVTAQVALCFLLLTGAGLFTRTLINLKYVHTGFGALENLVAFQVDPVRNGYTVERSHQLCSDVLREIQSTPGVKSAAFAMVPVLHNVEWDMGVSVEGHQAKDGEDMQAYFNAVSPGYWQTMGVPVLEGRDFDGLDRFDTFVPGKDPNVVIVNRKFAEHYFPHQSAIGRHVAFGPNQRQLGMRIVGVVENSLYEGPRNGVRRQLFAPYLQADRPIPAVFYTRTTAESAAMFRTLRSIVARYDRSLPVYEMRTLQNQLDETLTTERMIASLSVVFGALATLLAALGLYGVMAFVVARRTKEIGLRMALGAPRASVLWLVFREMLVLVGTGLAIGIPCAYVLSHYISSQLFGVKPTDLWTGAAAIVILGLAATVSAFVPARRASSIDPTIALRYE